MTRRGLPVSFALAVLSAASLGLAGCGNEVPFFTHVPEKERPVAVIGPVVVEETGAGASSFDAFVRYEASGEASHDADGTVVGWAWRVLARPEGSGMALEPAGGDADGRVVRFRPDLVGAYAIELVVTDDDGLESEPAVHELEVVSASGLLLQLTWDRDYTDVDLHLVHERPGASFYSAPWDCYFQNRNPDWGVPGVGGDDPLLPADLDDGYGPELIGLRQPPAGTYRVWSHYYCDDGFGGTNATVRVFLDGAMVAENTATLLRTGDLWEVAALSIASDGTPSLAMATAGIAAIERGCE